MDLSLLNPLSLSALIVYTACMVLGCMLRRWLHLIAILLTLTSTVFVSIIGCILGSSVWFLYGVAIVTSGVVLACVVGYVVSYDDSLESQFIILMLIFGFLGVGSMIASLFV